MMKSALRAIAIGWVGLVFGAMVLAASPSAEAPGFRVEADSHGVWWFVGPDGERFYSLGVNNVSPEPFRPREGTRFYDPVPKEFGGDAEAWGRSTRGLLLEHGFNTLGAWSSTRVPAGSGLLTTPVLYVVAHAPERCLSPLRPDFETFVRENVKTAMATLPERSSILGVFLDNEMPWFGRSGWDDIPTYTLLERALEQPKDDQARRGAVKFLQSRHADIGAMGKAYGLTLGAWDQLEAKELQSANTEAAKADRTAFTKLLADRFFDVTTRIVREELPGLLILGTRFPGDAPEAVIRACGRDCDVVSVNMYAFGSKPDVGQFAKFWLLGGRPLMHTEFSWRASENNSGCPNTRGAGAVLKTQAQRAERYSAFVSDMASLPVVIGSHWFEFADQSPQGRFDGEDSNYGIVDIENKPYRELLSAMRDTHARVASIHRETSRSMPKSLDAITAVTYSPGQHPDRPSSLDLLGEWIAPPEIWGASDAKLHWSRQGEDLILDYEAGSQYGAGINIFGPAERKLEHGPRFACDLDGYQFIVIDFSAPKGLQLSVVLAEAGAAAADAGEFDTTAGDDGEAYISTPVFSSGNRTSERIPISSLSRQQFYGNRAGKRRIDMQAVRNLGLQVQGSPAAGRVTVYAIRLEK